MLTFDDCLALAGIEPERVSAVGGLGTVPALHLMSLATAEGIDGEPPCTETGETAP